MRPSVLFQFNIRISIYEFSDSTESLQFTNTTTNCVCPQDSLRPQSIRFFAVYDERFDASIGSRMKIVVPFP